MNVSVCFLWCKKCLRADLWRASQQVGGAVEQQVGLCVSTISPSIIFHPSPSIWDLEFNRPTKEGALSHLNNTLTLARYPHDMVTHILHTHTLFFWRHCLFNLQLCVCIEREREARAERRGTSRAVHVRALVPPSLWILQHQRAEERLGVPMMTSVWCVMSHSAVAVRRRRKGETCEGEEGLRYEATGINPKQHLSCCHGGLPEPE